jgi:hypothetical protein
VMSREVREKSASFYNNYNLLGLDIFMDTSFRYNRIQLSVVFGFLNQGVQESIPPGYKGWWNRFLGSLNVYKFGICIFGRGSGKTTGICSSSMPRPPPLPSSTSLPTIPTL